MKVFLCFAFEKGELQRGHLSPDKESRELFAKYKGEALIIGVTDKRHCRVSSCPPLCPVPAASQQALLAPMLPPSPDPASSPLCLGLGVLGGARMDLPGSGRWGQGDRCPQGGCTHMAGGTMQGGCPLCPSANALLKGQEKYCQHSLPGAPALPRCSCWVRQDHGGNQMGENLVPEQPAIISFPAAAQPAPAARRAGS